MTTSQEASTAAGAGVNPQLPWASIPKFTPGVTNVQEYTQKLKFLAAMWPSESLELLAPRAALLVEGTAFRKVARLDPSKLKVANLSGIALLVEAIGGSWSWRSGMSSSRKPCTGRCNVQMKATIAILPGWKTISLSCSHATPNWKKFRPTCFSDSQR